MVAGGGLAMRIFVIDGQVSSMSALATAVRAAAPEAEQLRFRAGRAALEAMEHTPCDVVFLDVGLTDMDGAALAKRLRELHPMVNLIFTAARPGDMTHLLEMHASGFLCRPYRVERIRRELNDLRYSPAAEEPKRVHIQTFGNFEVYIDGAPLSFRHGKTKEFLAYLVDRGTLCSNAEIIAALWEDRDVEPSYFRLLRKDLVDALCAHGCGDVLLRRRGFQGVDAQKVSCDLYDWRAGKSEALHSYRGEYMSQYSWAEFTRGSME